MRLRPRGQDTMRELLARRAEERQGRCGLDTTIENTLVSFGLKDDADRPRWQLPRAKRWALALAAAVIGSPRVVILDGVLDSIDEPTRHGLVHVLEELTGQGSVVLWSEHHLEPVAEVARSVVELHHGRASSNPIGSWIPRGQDRPVLMRLVEGLDLDRTSWPLPERVNDELRQRGRAPILMVPSVQRLSVRRGVEAAHPPLEIPAVSLGVDEGQATIMAGERVGVLCSSPDRARALVSSIAAAIGAPRVTRAEALLSFESLHRVFGAWDRSYPAEVATSEVFDDLLGPTVRLSCGNVRVSSLSAGQHIAARCAMLLAGTGPCVLPDPSAQMDARMIGRFEALWEEPINQTRAMVLVGHRPDALVALCGRIIEIDDRRIVQDAGSMLAQRSVRCRTVLSRACAPLLVRRVEDALALLTEPLLPGVSR